MAGGIQSSTLILSGPFAMSKNKDLFEKLA